MGDSGRRRNVLVLLAGQFGRVAIQGLYFVLLARSLGAADFGASAALVAVVSMVLPFSSLGSVLMLVRNVAQSPPAAAVQFSTTVAVVLVSGTGLTLLLLPLSGALAAAGIGWQVVLAIAFSDLVLARIVEAAGSLFHAQERMHHSASFPVILQAARLLGLVVLIVGPWAVTLGTWALAYAGSTAPVALVLAVIAFRDAGLAWPQPRLYLRDWRTGILFSISMSSTTIYNDVDKVMLARLSTLQSTGTYSAAYRVVDMAYAPVRSLLGAASPAMWRAGVHGDLEAVMTVVRTRLVRPVALYCSVGTVALIVAADFLPLVLGESFRDSVPALRWLSVLLLLKGAHYVIGDALTCAGRQGPRTAVQVAVAVVNIGLCAALIPAYGWGGAVVASILSDGLLLLGFLVIMRTALRRRQARASTGA